MQKARYIDENMNRCCSINSLNNPINYERKRTNQLTAILKETNYHIDIHSTSAPTNSMFIHTQKSYKNFKDIFNTEEIYKNLAETVI
jgi:succinylglutamate desuccinylase